MVRAPCQVTACPRAPYARGWCKTHYQQWRQTGECEGTEPRPRPPRPVISREEQARRRAKVHADRRADLAAIKLARGCVDCGYSAHPAALQFDHRGDKREGWVSFARQLARSWSVILEEVAKCDVRCANCHAIKTATG